MKFRILFLIGVAVALLCIHPVLLNAKQGHVYIDGIVASISERTITVDGKDYSIAPDCRIVQHIENKGAFHEETAELSDIEINVYVYMKVQDNIVNEILIEDWAHGGKQ